MRIRIRNICKYTYTYIHIYIQVKKKVFNINAKIEDIGLNEDLKSTETRNDH